MFYLSCRPTGGAADVTCAPAERPHVSICTQLETVSYFITHIIFSSPLFFYTALPCNVIGVLFPNHGTMLLQDNTSKVDILTGRYLVVKVMIKIG